MKRILTFLLVLILVFSLTTVSLAEDTVVAEAYYLDTNEKAGEFTSSEFFNAVMDNVWSGCVIKLTQDITLDMTVQNGMAVALAPMYSDIDLNGHTLTVTGDLASQTSIHYVYAIGIMQGETHYFGNGTVVLDFTLPELGEEIVVAGLYIGVQGEFEIDNLALIATERCAVRDAITFANWGVETSFTNCVIDAGDTLVSSSTNQGYKVILNSGSYKNVPESSTQITVETGTKLENVEGVDAGTTVITSTNTTAIIVSDGNAYLYDTLQDAVDAAPALAGEESTEILLVKQPESTEVTLPAGAPDITLAPLDESDDIKLEEVTIKDANGNTVNITDDGKLEVVTPPEPVVPDPHPITVAQPANGTISTSLSNSSVGATITVTAMPNSGYELAYITVNGERIDGASFTMPDEAVTVSAVFVPVSGGFADVVPGAWYVDAVNYVVSRGLMEGTSATTFEPDAQMTRAMFWTILARIDGETITGATWADDARAWAVANNVSDGTDPHGALTREQLVTMLWRYLGELTTSGTLTAFTDAASVSDWAETAMAWAVNEGVITGVTATTLAPQSVATRAQCATILMRNAF